MPPTSFLDTPPSLANSAEIILPPGTTLPQFVSLQGSLVTAAMTVAVAFGVLICDYLHLFPHEIKLYQTSGKALWSNPATWAFVLLRYSGILATLPALFLTFIQNKYCQAVVLSSQVGIVLVVASSGLIFVFRLTAMWGGHKAIYAVVGMMYVVMVGCGCVVISQDRTETGPPAPFGSNCHMRPLVSWAPIASASSVAFDAVVLLLAVFKSSSPAAYATYRDSKVCFFITTVANVAVLVIQVLGPSFDHIKPIVTVISTLITAMMGARVYLLHLRLSNKRKTLFDPVLPMTLMGDSRGARAYANPATPPHSGETATLQGDVPKAYPIEFSAPGPDTPFASYDYDTPKDMTHFPKPVVMRETVVTVE